MTDPRAPDRDPSRWPFAALLVYLSIDFLRPQDVWPVLRLRPMLLVGALALALALWARWRRAPVARPPTLPPGWPLLLPIGVLIGCVALGALTSVDVARSLGAAIDVAKLGVVAWLVAVLVSSPARLRAVLWVIALSLGALAVHALVQMAASGFPAAYISARVAHGPHGLGDGAYRDNNDLARGLAFALPLFWTLAAWPGRFAPAGRGVAVAGVVACAEAIVCTFSRGGFIALLVGLAALALAWRPRWRRLAIAAGCVAALLVLAPPAYRARLATIAHPLDDASIRGRLDAWRAAAELFARHPFSGQGAETFELSETGHPANRRAAHNIFVQAAAEVGGLGLAAYLWLVAAVLLALRRVRRGTDAADWRRTAAVGLQAALLAHLTAGLALGQPFLSPLFVIAGLAAALGQATSDER